MLKSMTGYGLSRFQNQDCDIEIEIKTLNSKSLDVSLRMSSLFSDKESEIRSLLQQHLERGKVFFSLTLKDKSNKINLLDLNSELAQLYYSKLETLADQLMASKHDLFRLVVMQPDVLSKKLDERALENQWQLVVEQIMKALEECNRFRLQEGFAMQEKINICLTQIEDGMQKIIELDPERIEKLRTKFFNQLQEIQNVNQDRFEQEIIYYIEKLDISEELLRLKNHLSFFRENMIESFGRKLGFISQEIGREINTIGSKASYSPIQQWVVVMKDELEKIKELLANVL
jgi:uncharacterized protein (TIGR00255 family)